MKREFRKFEVVGAPSVLVRRVLSREIGAERKCMVGWKEREIAQLAKQS